MSGLRTLQLPQTCIALSALGGAGSTDTQVRDRAEIPDQYKWNLADLYPSADAWREAKESFSIDLRRVALYRGQLGVSARALVEALETASALNKELDRLVTYAARLADQDMRDSAHQGMKQEMLQLAAMFNAERAYVEPEILRIDKRTIEAFLAAEPRLHVYRFYLEDLGRRAAHTRTDEEERLLAAVGPLARLSSHTYTILTNADLPYPTITLSDGRDVRVDPAAYPELRALPSRGDREIAMSAFFTSLGRYRRTFAATMNGQVQKALFFSNARGYGSALEMSLDEANIPLSVYSRLLDGIDRNLSTLHRYLKLRQRLLGVEELHYYDLYAPLVESVTLEYTPEQAEALVLEALAPLGAAYVSVVQRAFRQRWIDLYPSEGKISGAYCSGDAYDVHPYILLNYNGSYADVSTIAHELGHMMQSYLSNRTQPYPLAEYHTFVAEVASTFNELLLVDHLLETVTDDETRLALLGNHLETIKGTVFRQTQFADFELRMHEMAARGQAITADSLASVFMEVTRRYYGHEQGLLVVDDYIASEWSYIPHFYRDFYVFQYATSFAASVALAAKLKRGHPDTLARYIAFLSAGGLKYPIQLLKDAGVDMTTDEPLELTLATMNEAMDDMERLLAKRNGGGS